MTTEFNRLWDQVEHDLGFNDHNMRRDRPYNGQPHTCTGTRGATEIRGITFRDLRDCFIRAYIRSHPYYVEGTIAQVQPNAALSDEADKGENAALCENDVYKLQGDIDPIAVVQNLCCEVERIMGIFPNVPALTQPQTNRHTGG
jgi:hypothetical protein